jgi:hypothetical protein
MMSVDENLMCSFQILKPANKVGNFNNTINLRGVTPPKDKKSSYGR